MIGTNEQEALAQIREWAEEVGIAEPVYIDHVVDILNEFRVGSRDAQPGWKLAKWSELQADGEDNYPTGDTIRLTWDDGTVLVGRLSVMSHGSGHHQMCRMQTVFGGDTYVYPHGSTLERKVAA